MKLPESQKEIHLWSYHPAPNYWITCLILSSFDSTNHTHRPANMHPADHMSIEVE